MSSEFIIPLNGLAAGESRFSWQAGKEFFDSFENAEIIDAQLDVDALAEKSGRYVGVDCDVRGTVVVECDRCLDELEMPVDVEIRLSVKYGDQESSEEPQPGEREVVFIPETDADFDLSQIIYDYVCLSLPMQRVHAPGSCNPDAMKYYGVREDEGMTEEEEMNNPFSALKDMFK